MKKSNFYVVMLFALLTIMATMVSCTDAEKSKLGGYGDTFTVKVIGPDTIITYHSTGKVISEQHSDGYYFTNRENGKLIEVSGNVIIEQE
jgi:uncharacterized lipoprotein YehR (DUF1307 family)